MTINADDLEAFGYYEGNYHNSYKDYKQLLEIRNMTPLQMVRQFAKAMDQPLDEDWKVGSNLEAFRFGLIEEEYDEFGEAMKPEHMLKELADLVYVCYGYAATFGYDLDEALVRVHKSNLSKLGDDGKPIKNEEGKVTKSDNYIKPNLQDLV